MPNDYQPPSAPVRRHFFANMTQLVLAATRAERALVEEAGRLAQGADSVEACELARQRLLQIIDELGDKPDSVAAVRGYAEMLAMTRLALEDVEEAQK